MQPYYEGASNRAREGERGPCAAGLLLACALLVLSCGNDPVGTAGDAGVGPPVRLAFQAHSAEVEGSGPIAPSVRVAVQDASGATVSTATHRVTLSILEGPDGATLSGTLLVDAAAGIAEFDDLSLDLPGEYTLEASAPGLDGAESGTIRTVLTFVDVSAGQHHTCAFTVAEAVYCWGLGTQGQLGDGGVVEQFRPRPGPVASDLSFRAVSAGIQHTCALSTDSRAHCWGLNGGRIGDGTTEGIRDRPTPVSGGLEFASILAGPAHNCAVTASERAYCWGDNTSGQLGDDSQTKRLEPTEVGGSAPDFAVVSPGQFHTCGFAVPSTRGGGGAGYCWGGNATGQLGTGTDAPRSLTPTPVARLLAFRDLSSGTRHSCGVTPDGEGYCWGLGEFGRLGNGSDSTRTAPHPVSGNLAFSLIRAGEFHSCGITTGGETYCWGANSDGRLGDGSTERRLSPVPVAGGPALSAVSAGSFHTCGLTAGGEAYCWGNNRFGQLGDGTTINSSVPVRVIR